MFITSRKYYQNKLSATNIFGKYSNQNLVTWINTQMSPDKNYSIFDLTMKGW